MAINRYRISFPFSADHHRGPRGTLRREGRCINWGVNSTSLDIHTLSDGFEQAAVVGQISNLPYRSASSLHAVDPPERVEMSTVCRLEIGDTADWKSALRNCETSGLLRQAGAIEVLSA